VTKVAPVAHPLQHLHQGEVQQHGGAEPLRAKGGRVDMIHVAERWRCTSVGERGLHSLPLCSCPPLCSLLHHLLFVNYPRESHAPYERQRREMVGRCRRTAVGSPCAPRVCAARLLVSVHTCSPRWRVWKGCSLICTVHEVWRNCSAHACRPWRRVSATCAWTSCRCTTVRVSRARTQCMRSSPAWVGGTVHAVRTCSG
jgi:hypothetical protein